MFLGAGCGHLRILGNGCGRRKRFTTAHCGFERSKHNGRLFVRSAKWRVLHLFLEAGWRQRHCSESLKIGESATARAVICNIWRTIGPQPHCWGKVSLNVEWVKSFRLPAPMKFLRPDFKISRLSPRGRQKQTQNEKRSHFLASYCKQHLALAMTWKRKSGKWKPLWKAEGGEVFCFSLPQCSTPQSNHQQLQQKKKKQTI